MEKIGKVEGLRLYPSSRARAIAVTHLLKGKYNYFVGFWDVNKDAHYGLSFGVAGWVKEQPNLSFHRKDC